MQELDKKNEDDILTPKKAAEILGVTIQRISALCHSGRLHFRRIGFYKFPYLSSVMEYKIDENRLKHSPKHGEKMPTYMKK